MQVDIQKPVNCNPLLETCASYVHNPMNYAIHSLRPVQVIMLKPMNYNPLLEMYEVIVLKPVNYNHHPKSHPVEKVSE